MFLIHTRFLARQHARTPQVARLLLLWYTLVVGKARGCLSGGGASEPHRLKYIVVGASYIAPQLYSSALVRNPPKEEEESHMSKDKALIRPASDAALANFRELQTFYYDGAKHVKASHPVYLDLPPALANIAEDPWYREALAYGRFQYRDEMYDYDEETDSVVYWPLKYSRREVLETVDWQIRLPDLRLAVTLPLAWRVGFVTGWLSGLSIAQPDDAQAGIVMLAALVAPLLLTSPSPQEEKLSRHLLSLAPSLEKSG
jgi:hypothetical protein